MRSELQGGGRATVRGAARPAIVEALEASFKGIRECYAAKDMQGVLSHFLPDAVHRVDRHVAT